jgi:hypothetical protein
MKPCSKFSSPLRGGNVLFVEDWELVKCETKNMRKLYIQYIYIIIYIYIHQQKCNVTLIFRRDLVTSHIAMCPSASLRSVCPPWPALDVRHQWTQIILYRRLYIVFIDSSFSKKNGGICGGQVAFQEVSWCLDHFGSIWCDLTGMFHQWIWIAWPWKINGFIDHWNHPVTHGK